MICGYPKIRKLEPGNIIDAIFVVDDRGINKVLRVYNQDNDNTDFASLLREIDITMRIRHPSIVKGYEVITKETCDYPKLGHALLVDFVDCRPPKRNFFLDRLKIVLSFDGQIPLIANGYINVDVHAGNWCLTKIGMNRNLETQNSESSDFAVIYDFNAVNSIHLREFRRFMDDFQYYNSIVIKSVKNFWNYVKDMNINPLNKELAFDFYQKCLSSDNPLDIYELPTHPIFFLNNLTYEKISEVPREYVKGQWPMKNVDYHYPWRKFLREISESFTSSSNSSSKPSNRNVFRRTSPLESSITILLAAVDMYYRFLPYIDDASELDQAVVVCFDIQTGLREGSRGDPINQRKSAKGDYRFITDKIITCLRGNLNSNFLQDLWMCTNDILVCLELLGYDYDTYMHINPKKFYEIIKPNYEDGLTSDDISTFNSKFTLGKVLSWNIIDNPILPSYEKFNNSTLIDRFLKGNLLSEYEYIFSKLTVEELMEFLDLHEVEYPKTYEFMEPVKFFLADLAKRVFIYHSANDSLILTRAVEDLIYQSENKFEIDRMYDLEELENAGWEKIKILGDKIGLGEVSFLKERVIRILRMSYLIRTEK